MVASEGQGLARRGPRSPRRRLWEPVPLCHVSAIPACPTLCPGCRERQQAVQGLQKGWEAGAAGQGWEGSRPQHRTPCLPSGLEDKEKEEGEGEQEGLPRVEGQPGR